MSSPLNASTDAVFMARFTSQRAAFMSRVFRELRGVGLRVSSAGIFSAYNCTCVLNQCQEDAKRAVPLLDINAQDSEGRTVMHALVDKSDLRTMEELGIGGFLASFNHALKNKAGETVLQLAHKLTTVDVRPERGSRHRRVRACAVKAWEQARPEPPAVEEQLQSGSEGTKLDMQKGGSSK